MKSLRAMFASAVMLAVGACASVETATRNAIDPAGGSVIAAGGTTVAETRPAPDFDVRQVVVTVPGSLKVSEANVFYPIADIVWRGEPRGDRYAQVTKIFEEGAARATAAMTSGRPVVVELQVVRFHILTEKAKIFTGGTYAIHFDLTIRDAATGAVIDGPRLVSSDMPGSGGAKALQEEAEGLTQRVKIVAHLAEVIRDQLHAPIPVTVPAPAAGVSRGRSDLQLSLSAWNRGLR